MDFNDFYELCESIMSKVSYMDETQFALTMSAIIDCYELDHVGTNSLEIANNIVKFIGIAKESNYGLA